MTHRLNLLFAEVMSLGCLGHNLLMAVARTKRERPRFQHLRGVGVLFSLIARWEERGFLSSSLRCDACIFIFYLSEPLEKLEKPMWAAAQCHVSLCRLSLCQQCQVRWDLESSSKGNTEPSASGEEHTKSRELIQGFIHSQPRPSGCCKTLRDSAVQTVGLTNSSSPSAQGPFMATHSFSAFICYLNRFDG